MQTRRRNYRKRKNAKPSSRPIIKRPGLYRPRFRYNREPLATQYWCKMGYSDNVTVQSTAGTPNGHIFRSNSVFDPDYTGVGHQPYGHDTLAGIYNSYIVTGVKITIRVNASSNCIVSMRPQVSTSTPVNLTLEMERPDSKGVYVTGGDSRTMSMYVSNPGLFGRTRQQYLGDDIFKAATGSNPSTAGYWGVCVQHPDGVSTVAAYINIDMVYYVKWMNRKLLAQS